ncbi:MAG: ketoacid-CoA transferase [Rhodocyclaceae bacterium]|nr:MAG: ketoacid-CoA transferase [Rhodocyclaceae bacterium]
MTPRYSTVEMMAVAAAREIRDGEVVFAGTGLPMLATMLAQRTHAPDCVIVFEAGAIDPRMLQLPMSVGDSRTLVGAAQSAGLFEVFNYVLQGGRVDVGFLGGAQVDRYGNINSSAIGANPRDPEVRLPGSGGSADVAALSGRTVIIAHHERRRFPLRVDYRTSPGWIDGGDTRRAAGIYGGGPSALVTTLGVIRYREQTRLPYLASYHPGLDVQRVQAETGFELDLGEARETLPPSAGELDILRHQIDPEGIFFKPLK